MSRVWLPSAQEDGARGRWRPCPPQKPVPRSPDAAAVPPPQPHSAL